MKLITEKLKEGNRRYMATSSVSVRLDTARNGQHPYAIVICCSDSRVIPEQIFDAGLGELFVIRIWIGGVTAARAPGALSENGKFEAAEKFFCLDHGIK